MSSSEGGVPSATEVLVTKDRQEGVDRVDWAKGILKNSLGRFDRYLKSARDKTPFDGKLDQVDVAKRVHRSIHGPQLDPQGNLINYRREVTENLTIWPDVPSPANEQFIIYTSAVLPDEWTKMIPDKIVPPPPPKVPSAAQKTLQWMTSRIGPKTATQETLPPPESPPNPLDHFVTETYDIKKYTAAALNVLSRGGVRYDVGSDKLIQAWKIELDAETGDVQQLKSHIAAQQDFSRLQMVDIDFTKNRVVLQGNPVAGLEIGQYNIVNGRLLKSGESFEESVELATLVKEVCKDLPDLR